MQAAGCVLLGDPAYYARCGFKAEPGFQRPGVPPDHFMALAFYGPVPAGVAQYSDAFNAAAFAVAQAAAWWLGGLASSFGL